MTPEQLFNQYYKYTENLARKFHKHVNIPYFDAEDAIQCGLMGLWEAANKFEESRGHKFKNFAYSYIIGRIKDNLKRMNEIPRSLEAKTKTNEKLFMGGASSYDAVNDNIISQLTVNSEQEIMDKDDYQALKLKVKMVLDKLSKRQSYTLYAYYIKGLSLRDMANELGCTENTVGSHMFRAKSKFRQLYIQCNN